MNKVVDEDLREVVSTSCKAMHVIIFLWVMVRLSAHTAETLSPSAWHQTVLGSLANRLQCVGRAKRLKCWRPWNVPITRRLFEIGEPDSSIDEPKTLV